MTNRCEECPYKHEEKGKQPCLNCLGDVPYKEYFDQKAWKIIDIWELEESTIKKGPISDKINAIKKVLKEIYCDAQEMKVENEHRMKVHQKLAEKIKHEMIQHPLNIAKPKTLPGGPII